MKIEQNIPTITDADLEEMEKSFKKLAAGVALGASLMSGSGKAHTTSKDLHNAISGIKQSWEASGHKDRRINLSGEHDENGHGRGKYSIQIGPYAIKGVHSSGKQNIHSTKLLRDNRPDVISVKDPDGKHLETAKKIHQMLSTSGTTLNQAAPGQLNEYNEQKPAKPVPVKNNINPEDVVKSILGNDIFEILEKTEIHKLNTNTSLDPEEIKLALQIVPRAILSYLFAHLKHRATGDIIDLDLPFANAQLHVNKQGPDNYRGEIYQDGKKVLEFLHRSLPSIGLLILTTFELYDMSLLDEVKKDNINNEEQDKLQNIIDDRLNFNRLICDVVDKRISEREAIDKIIKDRLNNHIISLNNEKEEVPMEQEDKKNKLRSFLESREKRRREIVELDKSEKISCPDCATDLYKGGDCIKLCICFGQFHNKDLKFKKSTNGKIEIEFPKSFDTDNVELLLDTIKNNK